jgi:hypothetical protein
VKLIKGNGRTLEVYDLGPVVYRIEAQGHVPVPFYGSEILSDDEARAKLQELRAQGFKGAKVAE